jgi:hypothetical protein
MIKFLSIIVVLLANFSAICQVPAYLKEYMGDYRKNPREANLHWFLDAQFGMFIHHGLYSQLGKGEWVQLLDTIHLKVEDVKKRLKDCQQDGYNLLLNISPLPDGSVYPENIETLSNF